MTDVTPEMLRAVTRYCGDHSEVPDSVYFLLNGLARDLERKQTQAQRDEELGRIVYGEMYPDAAVYSWRAEGDVVQSQFIRAARAVREAIEAGK